MQALKSGLFSLRAELGKLIQARSITYFPPPVSYDHIDVPERAKLRFIDKVPQYVGNIRPPKMQKRLRLMRGPELVHNTLQHKQYGVIALRGGRMKWEHFEIVRMNVLRKLDTKLCFAIWRVDPPWQPVTKKGQGQRMGGGKGPIDHYVTPIKSGRVIMEVSGKCEFIEVKKLLDHIAHILPFRAEAVSQEIMEKKAEEERKFEEDNTNPYTMKYIIQNNLLGCHRWLSPYDFKYYARHR